MTTDGNFPTFTLRLQLAPRGDVRWTLTEGGGPFDPGSPGDWGGWCDPDDLWRELRQDLPVAIATWNHRVRRWQEASEGGSEASGWPIRRAEDHPQ